MKRVILIAVVAALVVGVFSEEAEELNLAEAKYGSSGGGGGNRTSSSFGGRPSSGSSFNSFRRPNFHGGSSGTGGGGSGYGSGGSTSFRRPNANHGPSNNNIENKPHCGGYGQNGNCGSPTSTTEAAPIVTEQPEPALTSAAPL